MEEREFIYIKSRIHKLLNVDLSSYKASQLKRRLRVWLARSGHANWPALFRAIENDQTELNRLKDYLTINVSYFFRDQDKFNQLESEILPNLLHQSPKLRVWSAGCSYGHEPYSLAIMLAEATSLYRAHFLLATDIDQAALAHAAIGGPYTAEQVNAIPQHLLESYFKAQDESYYVIPLLQRRITFRYHNLLADPFEDKFDLIVCRNVVIYFTREVKAKLYQRFYEALRPGGVMFVGGTEIISRAFDVEFEALGTSFYRRPLQ